MLKTLLLTAATFTALASAKNNRTDVSRISGCKTTELPPAKQPPRIYCGTQESAPNAFELCRNSCLMDDGCISFSFSASTNLCRSFGKPLIRQGYHDKTSEHDTVHYNRHCFKYSCPPANTTTCDGSDTTPPSFPDLGDDGCPTNAPPGYFLLQMSAEGSDYDGQYIQLLAPVQDYRAMATPDAGSATFFRLDDAGNLQSYNSCPESYFYGEQDYTAGHSHRYGAGYEAMFFQTMQALQSGPFYYKKVVCTAVSDGAGGKELDCLSFPNDSIFAYCNAESTQIEGLNLGNITAPYCDGVSVKMVCGGSRSRATI